MDISNVNLSPMLEIAKKGLNNSLKKIDKIEKTLKEGYEIDYEEDFLYLIKLIEKTLFDIRTQSHFADREQELERDLFNIAPVTVHYDEELESLRIIMPRLLKKTFSKGQSQYLKQLLFFLLREKSEEIPIKPSKDKMALVYVHTYPAEMTGVMDYDNMDTKTIQEVISMRLIGGDSMKKLNVLHFSKESVEEKTYIYLTKNDNLMSLLKKLNI